MRLFHGTTEAAADAILAGGFRDGEGFYMTDVRIVGVWLSDVPLDCNDHGKLDCTAMLAVDIELTPDEVASWELVEEGKPYREWLIPADVVNARARVSRYDESLSET